MKIDISSRFVSWELTDQEQEAAMIIPAEVRARIQNLRAAAAEELVNNAITPITGTEFDKMIQATLKGEIKAYDLLLAEVIPTANQEGN
jgi:hypothetical protein